VTGRAKPHAIAVALGLALGCDPTSAPSATGGLTGDAIEDGAGTSPAPDAGAPREDARHPGPTSQADVVPPVVVGPADAGVTAAASTSELARPGATGAPTPQEPPPALTAPMGRRRAQRAMMVYVEPRLGSEFRGKIPHGEVFEVYEIVPARANEEECRGEGWGRIEAAAYVCLRHTEAVEDEPAVIPARLADGRAPFFYARRQGKDGSPERPPAPVYRSRAAMLAKSRPERFLDIEHDYIFVERRRTRDGAFLVMPDRRVVRESDIRRLEPSVFRGRDMRASPAPAGTTMAWSVQWPHAAVRSEPHPDAAELARIPLHAPALAHGEVRIRAGDAWVAMVEPAVGWALADHVRHWVDHEPPADVRGDELWIDVDLDQQMLALRRGATVEFLTLISSGTPKHPTPLGLYRLASKWAYADMRSREGDPEEYFVEGVPWVQYFKGRYALHGTFWHNRFGRRTSHGCINLSAHDARWVYERTWPAAKPGWLMFNEHAQEPGTLVRIRKGPHHPPDRRTPLLAG
jgi:hypothetical protein